MRPAKPALTLCLLAAAGVAFAANQEPVDPMYQIPVPTEQKKISVGEEKAFADGKLTLAVTKAERTDVAVKVNGGGEVAMANSKLTLVGVDDATICTMVYLGLSGQRAIMSARCDPADANLKAALDAQAGAATVAVVDPAELVKTAAKGSLTNPYLGDPAAIAQGHELFLSNSCNGCHGGNGGGGMGPPYTNGVWVYGHEDDTLFRLVTEGSDALLSDGYTRVAREAVVGPMPPYEGIIVNSDDLWKILAWVRSVSPTDAPPLKQ